MSFLKALLASMLGFFLSMVLVSIFFGIVFVGIISSAARSERVSVPNNTVLKIVPRSIGEYAEPDPFELLSGESEKLTMRGYLDAIEQAKSDDRIKGIWMVLGDYAGGWAQAGELRDKLIEFKKSGKFIYATSNVEGYDEVNYFLATAADSVILDPSGGMEMNGIYAGLSFFKPMLDRIGVKVGVARAGNFKSAVEPFVLDSASPANREMMTDLVGRIFARFRSAVQESRKLSPEALDDILDNRVMLTAEEAKDLKLVDALMYDDQVSSLIKHRVKKDSVSSMPAMDIDDYAKSGDDGDDEASSGDEIAVVYAVGGIGAGESRYSPNPLFGGEMLGSETFAKAMKTAREDDDVKAVVIRIDSPGGDAAASEAMWREVVLTREKKPVIVSMAGVAASGGYFLAAGADTIVAEPSTLTGSIGVFKLWFNTQKLFSDKIGINTQIIRTNPHADIFSSARDASPLELAIAERGVDSVYHKFLDVVAKGRRLSVDSVNSIAQGRVWTGEEGKQIGLVDELGGLDRALEIAATRVGLKKGSYDLRILPRPKSVIESLAEKFGGMSTLMAARTPLDDYESIMKSLQERSGVQARIGDFRIR
jgi:protease-4